MKLSVVHIVWLDSEASNEWTPVGDVTGVLDTTHSVGLLIREDESFLLVALSYDPSTESINGYKKIPRTAIESVKVLTKLSI
jgi:hypothetical protein